MRRNPLYVFKDRNSIGIYDVPLKSIIQILDKGDGAPIFIELQAKTGLSSGSSIGDLLDNPDLYINLTASGSTPSELEKVEEGGHRGWRILGRVPDNYADIGQEAVDLSYSDGSNPNAGASGTYSIALGHNTEASGEAALSAGEGTKAVADEQAVFGKFNNPQTDTVLEAGIGSGEYARENGLEVHLNGIVKAPGSTNNNLEQNGTIDALVTKEYADDVDGKDINASEASPRTIKVRRGTEQERINKVFALGELVWTTDNNELWVGDGVTVGGIKVTASMESGFIQVSEKGSPDGVATLGFDGKIPNNQLPALAITSTFVVSSEQDQISLPAQEGDIAIRTDEYKNYVRMNSNTGTMADWQQLLVPADTVTSVNGQTGVVVLNLGDINGVDLTAVNTNDILMYNGTNWVSVNSDTVGRKTFIALDDTPAQYAGHNDEFVKVAFGANALEFTDTIDGGTYTGTTQGASAPTTLDSPVRTPRAPRDSGTTGTRTVGTGAAAGRFISF